ncbi:MAG TPA: hypoxanthine phosphoribosyltransferase [Longimicrobiales bacterium]|jgi:hypoxanthine phosphoribosyltransferase
MPTTFEHEGRLGERALKAVVFSADEIAARVRAVAAEITEAYGPTEDLLVLGLLKGSFIFLADLVRHIHLPLQVDFIVAASYGNQRVSSGAVELLYDPGAAVKDRAVLLVEDIVDSGTTLERLIPLLEERGPKSLDVCALLHKRLTKLNREPRWVGFDAPPAFLVGYGLDYSEHYRHLPYIGSL